MFRKAKVRLSRMLALMMILSAFSFCQRPALNTFASGSGPSFYDDFEDGNSKGWSVQKGSWAVKADGSNNTYCKTNSSDGFSKTGKTSWTDYAVEGKIKVDNFNGSNKVMLCGRYTDVKSFYAASLSNTNGGEVELRKMIGGNESVLKSVKFPLATATWYTVKLDMNGSNLSVYVDGSLILTASDTSLSVGAIALAAYKAKAKYDDIKVSGSGDTPTPTPVSYPIPVITSDTTAANVSSVTVTISNFGKAMIKQYKIDDGEWQSYTVPVTVTKNCTVYAQGSDSSGNKSAIGSLVINNIASAPVEAKEYDLFVSPSGNDSNKGTADAPLQTLSYAASVLKAGYTIYLKGGVHKYSTTINLQNSGTETATLKIRSYPGERAILDFSDQVYGASSRGIYLTGNYWYIYGIDITHAGDNGMKLEGSHNKIENCAFYNNGDSGLQLGFAHKTVNPDGNLCSYNEIINCDSYLNFDFDTVGGDADGFSCKMHNGKGNKFIGCRSWRNSDDGFDFFETDWGVEIDNCWTWHNADRTDFDAIYVQKMGKKMSSFQGNGNGFKLGGNGTGGSSKGVHVVKNSVSFDNYFGSKKGFDQNSHKGGVIIENNLSFGNGYNYMFEDSAPMEFKNNVSFEHRAVMDHEIATGSVEQNNSWNLSVQADASDFINLTEEAAKAPRQSDGSLPGNSFARLVSDSDLIDKGIDVGLPYKGSAPDLGAYECR